MEKRKSLRPRVKFVIKDFESTCVDICDNFFRNDQRLNGMHALKVAEQFDIDVNQLKGKTIEEKYAIVKGKILPVYERNFDLMKRKVDEYQRLWNKYEKRIQRNFQDIFNLEYTGDREVLGQVNINVVCPRYYSNWSFDIGVNKFDIGALTTPIHELTHFFWFDLWKEVFPNWTNSDFCAPSLAWGLSELVIDSIFSNTDFKNITREKPAYKYFYEIEYKGENLIEYFQKLFKENSIEEFMKKGYEFLIKNKELESEIIK